MAYAEDRPALAPQGVGPLAVQGAVVALWLAAGFAAGAHVSSDRYPTYQMLWTLLLLAAGLVVPLAGLGAAARRFRSLVPPGPIAVAFCVLFAAALSLDVAPPLRGGSRALTIGRLLLLGSSAVIAGWSIRRGRVSRLTLGAASLALSLAWVVCGMLRAPDAPKAAADPAVLAPSIAALLVLVPGIPRLDPPFATLRMLGTFVACAALLVLPMRAHDLLPMRAGGPTVQASTTGRSAILIVLDTLRRDHMSLYGYERKTTPAIDERAHRGIVFDDATSVANWTLPSHASMFTGLWPRSHGAYRLHGPRTTPAGEPDTHRPDAPPGRRGQRRAEGRHQNFEPLAPERQTLAEIASAGGYRTAGFTANYFNVSPSLGMSQGFQDYLSRGPRAAGMLPNTARDLGRWWDGRRAQYEEMPYFTAPEMTRAAISWLELNRGTPFFLFLNYMDAHTPNAAPGDQGIPLEGESPMTAADRKEGESHHGRFALSDAVRRGLVNEYDRELIHLDRSVGVLFDYLEKSGLTEKTLIVLTSDHGEYLGEHQLLGHLNDIYAEVVNVPLVIWQPGWTPGRTSHPVQVLDLFPTILQYLGLRVPEGTQGQPVMEVEHPIVSELSGSAEIPNIRTIRIGEYRYFGGTDGEERLFHSPTDPGEKNDLLHARPEQAALGRARLDEWLKGIPEAPRSSAPPTELDPEALEGLRALGYVH